MTVGLELQKATGSESLGRLLARKWNPSRGQGPLGHANGTRHGDKFHWGTRMEPVTVTSSVTMEPVTVTGSIRVPQMEPVAVPGSICMLVFELCCSP